MELGLQGARCIITGASDGIGAATALAFAREGAAVGLVARRQEMLDAVAADALAGGAPPRLWSPPISPTATHSSTRSPH